MQNASVYPILAVRVLLLLKVLHKVVVMMATWPSELGEQKCAGFVQVSLKYGSISMNALLYSDGDCKRAHSLYVGQVNKLIVHFSEQNHMLRVQTQRQTETQA